MAAIEFRHVDKVFPDGTRTISDLTFAVGDGEFLVIVGPSGCGKSTVLRMLAGLESVTGGEIVIDGRIVNDWPPQRRNMAMVFQDYALYPHMSVRQNLEFPLRLQRLGKDEVRRRVADTAQLLDLSAVLERKPRQLSGGQRQRVAMGRAVVRRPGVFLMDEPLSNVDAKLRVQIRTEIAALQGRLQTTTIYVTHDQVEAMTLGHRVVLLRGGVVQQIAPPQELYDRPANIFVAAFLGNPGMNIVPVALKPAGDGHLVIELFDQGPVRLRCPAAAERDRAATGWIGVRPEALCVADDRAETMKDTMTLTVEVTSVEALGHESLVYARLRHRQDAPSGGTSEQPAAELGAAPGTLVARLPAARAPATHAPGPHALGPHVLGAERTLRLAVNPEDIHIFGPDGGALAHSAATSTSRDSTGTHAHPAAGGPAATPQPAGRRWAPSR